MPVVIIMLAISVFWVVDKRGIEFYQFTLGGTAETDSRLGERLGPAIAKDEVANTIENILDVYLDQRP